MSSVYAPVAERAAHRCEYCRAPESIFTLRFEVDHIVPVSSGGADTFDNFALSCRACNLWKSNAISGLDPATEERTPLFNPRRDVWSDHFVVELADSIALVGRTPMGRATVEQLRINGAAQCEARRWWMLIGLFP